MMRMYSGDWSWVVYVGRLAQGDRDSRSGLPMHTGRESCLSDQPYDSVFSSPTCLGY